MGTIANNNSCYTHIGYRERLFFQIIPSRVIPVKIIDLMIALAVGCIRWIGSFLSPRMNDRKAMSAIFYVLRTGCQWNALPRSLGASSTVHDRFQEWRTRIQTYVD